MWENDEHSDGSTRIADIPSTDTDSVLECLADRQRRFLLEYLSQRSEPVVLEELVQYLSREGGEETTTTVSDDELADIPITLYHSHLPKLSEAGIIEFNHETNTVRKGPQFEMAKDVLRVCRDD